jgi:hypothetical protein
VHDLSLSVSLCLRLCLLLERFTNNPPCESVRAHRSLSPQALPLVFHLLEQYVQAGNTPEALQGVLQCLCSWYLFHFTNMNGHSCMLHVVMSME